LFWIFFFLKICRQISNFYIWSGLLVLYIKTEVNLRLSQWVLLRMRNTRISDKCWTEKRSISYVQFFFPPKIVALMR
jgi:hypothetical protein